MIKDLVEKTSKVAKDKNTISGIGNVNSSGVSLFNTTNNSGMISSNK